MIVVASEMEPHFKRIYWVLELEAWVDCLILLMTAMNRKMKWEKYVHENK